MENKLKTTTINGKEYFKPSDVQQLIDKTQTISNELNKELLIATSVKDNLTQEFSDFVEWYIGLTDKEYSIDIILVKWINAKSGIEIQKAGGIH